MQKTKHRKSIRKKIAVAGAFIGLFFGGVSGVNAATALYYSVGQSTADLKTGSPTVTIASGVATFSVAQTGNIGVGDRVTVATTTVMYISGKVSQTQWNVINATGTLPLATTTAPVTSIKHEYASLSAAVAGAGDVDHASTTNLVTGGYQLNVPVYYDSGPDTTAVSISGYTTGASNGIRIYAPTSTVAEVNQSQRHNGSWDATAYRLEVNNAGAMTIGVPYVTIDGLQIKNTNAYGQLLNINSASGGAITVSNNIIQGDSTNSNGVFIENVNLTVQVYNNVIYGLTGGNAINQDYPSSLSYVYNNTISGSATGLQRTNGSIVAKNNLISGCTTAASGTFAAGTDYNATNNATMGYAVTGSGNTHDRVSQTFTFTGGSDFHLTTSDAGARYHGVDLSADANLAFNTDIDGQVRPSPANVSWDIGADESATNVYYSVGQNTSDHKTGTPTVSISSGTATFSTAQTASNMGVGDRVTYSGTSIAYISQKISTTQWKLVTATGTTPADVTSQTVNSITHAFASLNAAVGNGSNPGIKAAGYLNTADLVTGNYVLNIPCYYDSGPDTTAVSINNFPEGGWATSANDYIRIYTPFNTSQEVNVSQRHSGKWDSTKYSLEISAAGNYTRNILNRVDYLRIDGLQFKLSNNDFQYAAVILEDDGYYPNRIHDASSQRFISDNIIWGVGTSTNSDYIRGFVGVTTGKEYIYNNIIYGFDLTGPNHSIALNLINSYVYNNTVYGNDLGFEPDSGGSVVAKNNIAQNNLSDYYTGWSTFAAGSSYNISSDASAPGTSSKASTTVQFVDSTNKDFHLSPSDTAAKNAGVDLSADANIAFSTDIDGQTRNAAVDAWDIGADEYRDIVAPTTTASPAGGTYTSTQNVTLSANETATIYYTTDGSTPTASSSVYASPIAITTSATLKFFGKDTSGNSETVRTESYTINIPIPIVASALVFLPAATSSIIEKPTEAQATSTPSVVPDESKPMASTTTMTEAQGTTESVYVDLGSYVTKRHLQLGSTGEDVKKLQQFLGLAGYLSESATGYYGPTTRKAVEKFQEDGKIATQGVDGYGEVGIRTRTAINEYLATKNAEGSTSEAQKKISDTLIVLQQQLLALLGQLLEAMKAQQK